MSSSLTGIVLHSVSGESGRNVRTEKFKSVEAQLRDEIREYKSVLANANEDLDAIMGEREDWEKEKRFMQEEMSAMQEEIDGLKEQVRKLKRKVKVQKRAARVKA